MAKKAKHKYKPTLDYFMTDSSSQQGISGDGIDWLRGLEGAAVGGFASFLFGLLLQSLMTISNVDPTLSPFVAGIAAAGGVAYGFAKGSNAL